MASQLYTNLFAIKSSIENCNDQLDKILERSEQPTYTELEYIQSTGTQYIDTGFTPTNNTKLELKISDVSSANTQGLLGAYTTWTDNCYLLYTYSGINWTFGGKKTVTTNFIGPHEITLYRGSVILNGTTVHSSTSAISDQINTTLHLFCHGTKNQFASYKLYYLKIYESNTLVRDFIPVKDSNGNVALLDLVNNVYYYNKGSGTFTAGNVIGSASLNNLEDRVTTIVNELNEKLLSENIRAGVTILEVAGTLPTIFETEEEMLNHIDYPDNTIALLYDSNLLGVYILSNKEWIKIGEPTEEVLAMIDLNNVNGTNDTYTGLGDTVENINSDLDEILGS